MVHPILLILWTLLLIWLAWEMAFEYMQYDFKPSAFSVGLWIFSLVGLIINFINRVIS